VPKWTGHWVGYYLQYLHAFLSEIKSIDLWGFAPTYYLCSFSHHTKLQIRVSHQADSRMNQLSNGFLPVVYALLYQETIKSLCASLSRTEALKWFCCWTNSQTALYVLSVVEQKFFVLSVIEPEHWSWISHRAIISYHLCTFCHWTKEHKHKSVRFIQPIFGFCMLKQAHASNLLSVRPFHHQTRANKYGPCHQTDSYLKSMCFTVIEQKHITMNWPSNWLLSWAYGFRVLHRMWVSEATLSSLLAFPSSNKSIKLLSVIKWKLTNWSSNRSTPMIYALPCQEQEHWSDSATKQIHSCNLCAFLSSKKGWVQIGHQTDPYPW